MSDPKRANLITVSGAKSTLNKLKETVRLTINLDESNEKAYPELDYKELVRAVLGKEKRINGTTPSDSFFDNDDDVKRKAREFERKYGGQSTYGNKSGTVKNKFADIGAGYDDNDSFIDNTDAYDEKIIPGVDTKHGGFHIHSGSLEFKPVDEVEQNFRDNRKRRKISSSSSSNNSDSSSDSDSQDAKESKGITNGVDSHDTEHRQKKSKNSDKENAKKIRRTDSSAPTSGKQTSDDNAQGDGESGDSRSSDSLTSKPAPSSENAITSDSSRDMESKEEMKQLPSSVNQLLEEFEVLSRQLSKEDTKIEQCVGSLERALNKASANENIRRITSNYVAKMLNVTADNKLLQRLRRETLPQNETTPIPPTTSQIAQSTATIITTTITTTVTTTNTNTTSTTSTNNFKRKADDMLDHMDVSMLTPVEKEAKIEDTLVRLKILIEERKPAMIAAYKADCERVQEEKKKLQTTKTDGPTTDKRRPKRRFPWCSRARALLIRLAALAGTGRDAAALLSSRALPLFPEGFVRMPTLLKQADLHKEVKASDLKRPRVGSASYPSPVITNVPQYTETLQFPSSLTVTTSIKTIENNDEKDKYKVNTTISPNNFTINKELIIEKTEDRKREDVYKREDIPNNIGSITITPVNTQKDKKINEKSKEALIRVKSPAALNEMVHKKDKVKKPEKMKNIDTPLHIDTNFSNKKDLTSPKNKEEISQKHIENLRMMENNIPRPSLVSVHHSPTFVKPDKRPPEVKKKKEIIIVSDINPLDDNIQEPVNLDDSSSDLEIVEDKLDKSVNTKCQSEVPCKDKVKVNSVNENTSVSVSDADEITEEDIAGLTRSIQDMKNSQELPNLNCNYGSVITSPRSKSKNTYSRTDSRSKDNLMKKIHFFEQNGWIASQKDVNSLLRDEAMK